MNECNEDDICNFWDFHDGNCRLLSNEGNGPISGYDGAVGGRKNCMKIETGQKSTYVLTFTILHYIYKKYYMFTKITLRAK